MQAGAIAAAIHNRVLINVTDPAYGATGDGVTDDSLAIQAAADAVDTTIGKSATLYFPDLGASYLIGTATDDGTGKGGIKLKSGTRVTGDGFGSVVKIDSSLNYGGLSKMPLFAVPSGNSNVIIENIQLDGDAFVTDGDPTSGTAYPGAATEMEGIDLQGSDPGAGGAKVTDTLIRNVYIHDVFHDAIDHDYIDRSRVEGCFIVDCGWNAIHSGQQETWCWFQNNYIDNCGHLRKQSGIDELFGGIDCSATHAWVTNNFIENCPRCIYTGSGGKQIIVNDNVGINWDEQGNVGTGTGSNAESEAILARHDRGSLTGNILMNFTASASRGIRVLDNDAGMTVSANIIRASRLDLNIDCVGPIHVDGMKSVIGGTIYTVFVAGGAHVLTKIHSPSNPSASVRGAIHIDPTASGTVVSDSRTEGGNSGRHLFIEANDCICHGMQFSGAVAYYAEISGDDNQIYGSRMPGATTAGVLLASGAQYNMIYGINARGSTTDVDDSSGNATNQIGSAANIT